MPTAEKKKVVEQLEARLGEAKCLYLTDFTGLDVAGVSELRRRLSEANVDYLVVKNTLARLALEKGQYAELVGLLVGPNAFAFSNEDVVAPAKILTEFAKDGDRPQIKAGAIEGSLLSTDEIQRLATLPPRDVLLAEVVGYARAPIAGLVYSLNGLLSQFVRTLDAVRAHRADQEPEDEAAAPDPDSENVVETEEPAASDAETEKDDAEATAATEVTEQPEQGEEVEKQTEPKAEDEEEIEAEHEDAIGDDSADETEVSEDTEDPNA